MLRAVSVALLLHAANCSSPEAPSSDGTLGSGGVDSPGGESTTGGSPPSTGGRPASGGNTASGGSPSTGGAGLPSASGGAADSGGAGTAIGGGTPGSGGRSGGGQSEAGGAGSGGLSGSGGGSNGPYSFMALGDSITGTTCYTQYLARAFEEARGAEVSFVGSVTNNQVCAGAGNTKSEGHGGYLVTYLTTNSPPQSGKGRLSELSQWTQTKPDVVLIHFGTNDVWNNIPPAAILDAEEFVIEEFRKENPSILFFVSKIVPMNPNGCAECSSRVQTLNALVTDAWANRLSTATSAVHIVDQWSGFDTASDTTDGVHPNPGGGQKMAARAFETINLFLD